MAVAYASQASVTAGNLGTTTPSCNKPAGTVDGDLLLAFAFTTATGVTITPPAGWATDGGANGIFGFHRVASGEGTAYTFTRSANTNSMMVTIVRVTGASTSSPVDAYSGAATVTAGTTVDVPSLTAITGTYLFSTASSPTATVTWTPPGTMTEDFDVTSSPSAWQTAGAHQALTPGATGIKTWTLSAAGNKGAAMWSINQLVTTPPGVAGDTLETSMNRLAHTSGLTSQNAANVWAGTTGLDLVDALNTKAGNTLPNYRGLAGVLNQLAGSTGLEVDAAAAAIVS